VTPLARVMDFIPEDVDAMHKELDMWRNETQLSAARLQTEERSGVCRICENLTLSTFYLSVLPLDWFSVISRSLCA